MSDASEPPTSASRGEVAIPALGAAVARLRTGHAASRSHALLIGSPLDDLGGVAHCLRRMLVWLGREYEVVGTIVPPTKANIVSGFEQLRRAVEHGDRVLVYYAGHGKQARPGPDLHDQPLTVLLPIDARRSIPAHERLIPGYELAGWLEGLADACGVPLPELRRDEPGPVRVEPSVTLVLECCHSAGLTTPWPQAALNRDAIVENMGRELAESEVRGSDPMPRVLRVMASGRDEWAQGPAANDVGLMTDALVGRLLQHSDEPWWAVMDRLRMGWNEWTQHPAVAGPDASIPRSGYRFERPDGLWPCRRVDDERWDCALAQAAKVQVGEIAVLTSSLNVSGGTHGWFERDDDGIPYIRVPKIVAVDLTGDFAWVRRPAPSRRAIVDVWGGQERTRAGLVTVLERCAKLARDCGDERPTLASSPGTSATAMSSSRGMVLPASMSFELSGDGLILRDRWGDIVACTDFDAPMTWQAWMARLVELDQWLALEEQTGWPSEGFELRCGSWDDDGRHQEASQAAPTWSAGASVWVGVDAKPKIAPTCTPSFVSLFRVRGDRGIEALTAHVAGGLPLTGRYPRAGLFEAGESVRLTWSPGVVDPGPVRELLVAMISDQPLPMELLRRGPVMQRQRGRGTWLGTLVREYRLERA